MPRNLIRGREISACNFRDGYAPSKQSCGCWRNLEKESLQIENKNHVGKEIRKRMQSIERTGAASLERLCLQVTSDTISRLIAGSLIEFSRAIGKLRDWTGRFRADSSRAYTRVTHA